MATERITYKCKRCFYEWLRKGNPTLKPRACPKCKSYAWDREMATTRPEASSQTPPQAA